VPTPRSHAFTANGLRLVVHDWGGEGSPALLAHPTGFHGLVWEEVAEHLVAAGNHVWSFDFRGHGDSDAPAVDDDGYSWHGFADDVLAVARHLEVASRPDLLAAGHSKGGAALLLGEAKAPETFARIWAYEPIIFEAEVPLEPQDDFFLARSARKRRNVWNSRDEAFKSYASKPPLNVMTSRSLRAYVDYGFRDTGDGTLTLKCRPDVEARVYAMGPNHGAWQVLPDVDAKVLVACGERSKSIDPALATRLAARLPHGQVEVFAGLGHFGPQEDPAACARSMLAFRSS
jgi:pimeloyl-ACP methyl ester carboxylesterase